MSFLNVLLTFLKLSIISFGGGTALLPVIGEELVEKKNWLAREKFNYGIAVIASSPGSQPVALCTIWHGVHAGRGRRVDGLWGCGRAVPCVSVVAREI